MISSMYEIVSRTQRRYLQGWQPEMLSTTLPDFSTAGDIIGEISRKVNQWLDQQFREHTSKENIEIQMNYLLNLNNKIIIDKWPPIDTTNQISVAWYRYDLMIYLGLRYLLYQICTHAGGWIKNLSSPSLTSLIPVYEGNQQEFNELTKQIGEQHQWIDHFVTETQTTPYLVEVNKLTKAIRNNAKEEDHKYFPVKMVEIIRQYQPETGKSENEAISMIRQLRKQFELRKKDDDIIDLQRHLMRIIQTTLSKESQLKEELSILYLTFYHENENLIEGEKQFWKELFQLMPQYDANWLQCINNLRSSDEIPEDLSLEWKGTVQEFVKMFHPLIVKGKIKVKGNSDLTPIVKMLYWMFHIDKSRGVGFITMSSLISYFKKYSSEGYI